MSKLYRRREFLQQLLALTLAGVGAGACGGSKPPTPDLAPDPTPEPERVAPASPKPQQGPAATTAHVPAAPDAAATAAGNTQSPAPEPSAAAVAATTAPLPDLAVARGAGADPGELTRRAIAALGGIERFVMSGASVILKPNICNAYHGPEYASTTNPEVVAAVVALCMGAGARRVQVMDSPFGGTPQNAYASSGIADAVKAAGGEMVVMSRLGYRQLAIPGGRKIKQWDVYGDAIDADVLINMPVAKSHGATRLTLGMKNLMGIIQDRGGFHSRGLDQCIADLSTVVRPQLTVVDAVRILLRNGPTGGNLDDVKRADTVIASADVVAADAYAATLFGMTGADIGYVRLGAEMGIGRMDLGAMNVAEIAV